MIKMAIPNRGSQYFCKNVFSGGGASGKPVVGFVGCAAGAAAGLGLYGQLVEHPYTWPMEGSKQLTLRFGLVFARPP